MNIGNKIKVAIGKGRATGVITETKKDDGLGTFYKLTISSASPSLKCIVRNNELWVCSAEILRRA